MMICLVTVSPGTLRHVRPPDFLAALGRALVPLREAFPRGGVHVLSGRDDVLALARELGLNGRAAAGAPGGDFPWAPGLRAGYAALREGGSGAGVVHVEASLLLEDRAAFLGFLDRARALPSAPVIGMRQARDHPCQMFSAWRITDFATLGAEGVPLAEADRGAWTWSRSRDGGHFLLHSPEGESLPDAVYAEVFDERGLRLARQLAEIVPGAERGRVPLGPLPDEASCVCAFALKRVTEGGYDMTLPFGDVATLWHLEESSGKIVNEMSGQYIFGRQECPAVFHGQVLLAYFPPAMPPAMFDAPLQEFQLFPLDCFPAGTGGDAES